jgi:hypothetical protein
MTKKQLAKWKQQMQEIAAGGDPEIAHPRADDLLCAILRELGAGEVADIFDAMDKWYVQLQED